MAEGFHSLTHAGKTHHVSRLTQARKDKFESISKAKALAAVLQLRSCNIPADDYEAAYADAMDRINSGAFAFHSPFTVKALKTHGGMLQLACVLFDVREEEMINLFVARGDDVRAILDLVIRESNATASATADPTAAV